MPIGVFFDTSDIGRDSMIVKTIHILPLRKLQRTNPLQFLNSRPTGQRGPKMRTDIHFRNSLFSPAGPNSRPPAQLSPDGPAGQNASLFYFAFCNSFKDLSLVYSLRSLMSLPFSHMYEGPSVLFVRSNSSKWARYRCFGVLPQCPPKRSMMRGIVGSLRIV